MKSDPVRSSVSTSTLDGVATSAAIGMIGAVRALRGRKRLCFNRRSWAGDQRGRTNCCALQKIAPVDSYRFLGFCHRALSFPPSFTA